MARLDPEAWRLHGGTSKRWAEAALREPLRLLDDHAHLEKKAASNALDLIGRWPEQTPAGRQRGKAPPRRWVVALSRIVRDEAQHLAQVIGEIETRGGTWSKAHRNVYAQELRKSVRIGDGPDETVDRLLVSALIEARSHDRFAALSETADDDLGALYRGLMHAEAGHFLVFVELALQVRNERDVRARWDELTRIESEVLARLPPGPQMHSGEP
jgi:tRNA 2-(methylsulfanyl)-N6-isopentenyladenosine37 hydroxylase